MHAVLAGFLALAFLAAVVVVSAARLSSRLTQQHIVVRGREGRDGRQS